jgi:pyrroline-5-carboxylate reductase
MIGFIGLGNMGSAMINGLVNAGYVAEGIYVFDINEDKVEKMEELGLKVPSLGHATAAHPPCANRIPSA